MNDDEGRLDRLRAEVEALYQRNRQCGHAAWCDLDYDFVCPSLSTYPFQWFWDSCFHAIVLSRLDPARGEAELRSLVANQQPDGFIAHVTFWQRERYEAMLETYAIAYRTPYLSDCMQPPLLAEAVQAVARRGRGSDFLEEILPAVRRYYDWCATTRDPDDDGLIAVLQPDETGLDHTPVFDSYLGIANAEHDDPDAFTAAWHRVADPYATVGRDAGRMVGLDRFVVEDVLVNTIYAENERIMAELLEECGDLEAGADFRRRAEHTEQALVAKCWHAEAGLFFDLAGLHEEPLRVSGITSLLPLLLPRMDSSIVQALVAHLVDPSDYGVPFPVPSVSRREPAYRPKPVDALVWRGPSWINTNWYLCRGLRRHGYAEVAHLIEDRTATMVERSGFREYYDPDTGDGYGAQDFSWSGLVLDMLVSREDG